MKESEPVCWDKYYEDTTRILTSKKLSGRIFHHLRRMFLKHPLVPKIIRVVQENNVRIFLEAGCGTGDILFHMIPCAAIEVAV